MDEGSFEKLNVCDWIYNDDDFVITFLKTVLWLTLTKAGNMKLLNVKWLWY